jgi:GNAT superfamily N-acetyltransferase
MGELFIRPAGPGEAAQVARTHVRADEETYRPIFRERFTGVPFEESLQRWETALAAGDELLVVTDNSGIVGLAHATETWMSALYLLASHHRRGIGARLLVELCGRLKGRGVTEIGFQAVADNAQAIAFYEAMGARLVGRKTLGDGDNAWEDVVFALATDAPALRRG